MGKPWYRSKTIWINTLSLVAILVQYATGVDYIDPDVQAGALAVINCILRIVTHEPLT